MSWNLTDGTDVFVTIHDECPEEVALFIMDSVYEFLALGDCPEVGYDCEEIC